MSELQAVVRPVLNWILKRYPGRDPPTCSNCLCRRATQELIAECNNLFEEINVPLAPRFKPEHVLCNTPPDLTNRSNLFLIALSIAKAVHGSLPDLDFEILSF